MGGTVSAKVREQLEAAGAAHKAARAASSEATKRLHKAIKAANGAGVPNTEIAKITGINRVTVQQILKG